VGSDAANVSCHRAEETVMFRYKALAFVAVLALPLPALAQAAKEAGPTAVATPKAESPVTTTPSSSAKVTPVKDKQLSAAEEFNLEMKRCMDAWDAGTSMTKTKWREICHRTLKERLPHRRASSTGTAPPKPPLR
jgi:hypothetical protein